jgi:F420-dependent oxidoreductase-like protein
MRIGFDLLGVMDPDFDLRRAGQLAADAEEAGFDSVWFPNLTRGADALSLITLAGQATSTIELGTAVVPTYPRHPLAMAQQAATTNVLVNGRLALGIGPSHRMRIEDEHGLSYEKPARHVREYLSVLVPVLREGSVDFKGETYRVTSGLQVQENVPFPVLISALAPAMLRAAGELCDGTITWMAGRRAIDDHIVPRVTAAAEAAGRPSPRIVVALPVAVSDPDEGRRAAVSNFGVYAQLPNYRRMLDTGNADGPGDVAIVGDEEAVVSELRALAASGVTDFSAAILHVGDEAAAREGSFRRTYELLASLARTGL